MKIDEMHLMFRQYAQQMGMQYVRAILPEQIDLFINNAISDAINEVITTNIAETTDRVITDNSKLGQTNAFRKLYKVVEVGSDANGLSKESAFTLKYSYDMTANATLYDQVAQKDKYLYLVDVSVNYKKGDFTTNWFPVRIIDDSKLSDVLNDFILSPRLRSPASVIYNNTMDVYIDRLKNGKLPNDMELNKFRISYLSMPATVKYVADLNSENVDCDLPDYMHVDIVKHAVDLYRSALSGSLIAKQNSDTQQRRENYRNDATDSGS